MNLGSRLKQVLEEKNMTVSQLARESGVPAQTLYAMINRDSNKADMDSMAKLLIALDMDLPEFMQMPARPGKAQKKTASRFAETEKRTKKTKSSDADQQETRMSDADLSKKMQEEQEKLDQQKAAEAESESRQSRRDLADYLL